MRTSWALVKRALALCSLIGAPIPATTFAGVWCESQGSQITYETGNCVYADLINTCFDSSDGNSYICYAPVELCVTETGATLSGSSDSYCWFLG